MNRFMTRVSDLVEEECRTTMLVDDMDISLLMVFAQQIDVSTIKKDKKRIRMDKEGSNGHDHSMNWQKNFWQCHSSASKYEDEKVSNR